MHALKSMLMIAMGLGVTWAAWQVAPASTSAMLGSIAYAQEPAAAGSDSGETIDVDAQLEKIEAAMKNEGEVKEFKPTEPLPADLAIEMSSEL